MDQKNDVSFIDQIRAISALSDRVTQLTKAVCLKRTATGWLASSYDWLTSTEFEAEAPTIYEATTLMSQKIRLFYIGEETASNLSKSINDAFVEFNVSTVKPAGNA